MESVGPAAVLVCGAGLVSDTVLGDVLVKEDRSATIATHVASIGAVLTAEDRLWGNVDVGNAACLAILIRSLSAEVASMAQQDPQ